MRSSTDTQQVLSTSATVFGKKQPFVGLKRGGDYTLYPNHYSLFLSAFRCCCRLAFCGWRLRRRRTLRHHSGRQLLLQLLRRWRLNRKVFSNGDMIALPLHDLVDQILFFLLLDGFTRLILWRL